MGSYVKTINYMTQNSNHVDVVEREVLVQISDLHFSQLVPKKGVDPSENLKKILGKNLNTFLLLTGDLTSFGDIESYKALKVVLTGRDYIACTGNHDVLENMRSVLGCGDDEVVSRGFYQIISLNTLRTGEVGGDLSKEQLRWLHEVVAREIPSLIIMHHPPCTMENHTVEGILLSKTATEGLNDVIAKNPGKVLGILTGHLHQMMISTLGGVPVVCAPSSAYSLQLGEHGITWHKNSGEYLVHEISPSGLSTRLECAEKWEPTEETLRNMEKFE